MTEGTGPGRGTPWWRSGRVLTLRHVYGWTGQVWGSTGRPEPVSVSRPREGRTVARISR